MTRTLRRGTIVAALVLSACVGGDEPLPAPAPPADVLPIEPAFYAAHGVTPADELLDRRTVTSYSFRRPDGRFVAYIAATPLNYRDAAGRLRPIDTAIVAHPDGWSSPANSLPARFGGDAAGGVAAGPVRWTPTRRIVDTAAGPVITSAAAAAGRVDGSTVVYPATYPGVDEHWTVGRGELKHDLLLSAPPDDADPAGWLRFEGVLDGAGAVAPQVTGGGLELGVGGLRLEAPFAYERDRPTHATAAEYRVRRDDAGRLRVEIAVPQAWLVDPDRRYPVVIDPTVTLGSITGTVPIYVDNQVAHDCNGGTLVRGGQLSFLRIGLVDNNGPPSGGFWCYRAAFKFSTVAIPDNAAVSRVDFNGFVPDQSGVGDIDFVRLAADPVALSDAALFAAVDASATHYRSDLVPPATGSWFVAPPDGTVGIDLGATAAADLQAGLAADRFAFGAHRGNHADEWTIGPNVHHFVEIDRANTVDEPRIYVTYTAPPVVSAIDPPAGLASAATAVTITGERFFGVTGVTIGGAALTSVTTVSPTTITATVPAGITPGSHPVIVTAEGGTSAASTVPFTVYTPGAPTVLSISPAQGKTTVTTAVTIQGTSFSGTTSVTIAGTALTGVTVVDDGRITATVPFALAPGTYPVIVTTPLGDSTADTVDFTVEPGGSSVPWSLGFEVGEPAGVLSGSPEPGGWHIESSNGCFAFTPHGGARWLHEGTDAAGEYASGIQYHFYELGPFDLSGAYSSLTFALWRWMRMEGQVTGLVWDGLNVKLSTNGGASWTLLTPAGGYSEAAIESMDELAANEPGWGVDTATWVQASFDLTAYAGQTDVRIKLVFSSDSFGGDCGAAIDDLALTGVALPPPAPASVVLADGDTTLGLDGRDVTITWNEPGSIAQVSFYRLYLLPAATALGGSHTPLASIARQSAGAPRSFTGAASLTTDSAGQPLVGGASYRAHVVSVDAAGRTTAAASPAAVLTDDCIDGDGDTLCSIATGGTDCDDTVATCTTDCTGDVDGDATIDCTDGCLDGDGDGYGSPGGAPSTCAGPDCDDAEIAVHPGAAEVCNAVDDDCDGATGDGLDEAWLGDACDGSDADPCTEGSYTCSGGAQSCSDTTGDCHADASCGDESTGFACECDPGFVGDGFDCTDIDECALGTDDCEPDAVCTNLPGGFVCALCGDQATVGAEECDDGGTQDGDGCAADCTVEDGWECVFDEDSGELTCTEVCGDGLLVGAEEDLDDDGLEDGCDEDADGDGFVDGTELGGGGCACRGGGDGGVVAALAVALLLLGRRRRLAAVLVILLAPGTARAQEGHDEVAVERFRLAGDGDGLIGVDWAGVPMHGSWDLALWLGASHDPLVAYGPADGDQTAALVARRVASGISGSLALWGRLQLTIATTGVVYQDDRGTEDVFAMEPPVLPAGGLSDARFGAKLRVIGRENARLHVSLMPSLVVPLGAAGGFLRERGPTFEPEVALGLDLGAARLAVDAGYRLRGDHETATLSVGDELFVRAGVGYRIGERGDLVASIAAATAADAPMAGGHRDAFEVLGGAAITVGRVQLFVAGGAGIGAGYGTPDGRVVAGTRFGERRRDRDDDGLADRSDRCPGLAEERDGFADGDGCPDLDDDEDGIADAADRCPRQAEDRDGFEDADGCVDPDDDGDGVADAADRCPGEAEVKNGLADDDGCADVLPVVVRGRVVAGDTPLADVEVVIGDGESAQVVRSDAAGEFELVLAAPGPVRLRASKLRHRAADLTLDARAQVDPNQVVLDLEPMPPVGEIRGNVRSFRGKPLAARATVSPLGISAEADQDGLFRIEVPPGDYDVTIEAAGYRKQTRRVSVELDGVTVLNVDLKKR